MPIFLYVAVVSDNDGSAFITKAEFDSLKNNFQAQIDNYNQSIDSKIDGAIASYLAGIKVNTDDTPEYKIYGALYGPDPHKWMGKVSYAFYLVESGNGPWVDDATPGTNGFYNLDSSGYSNRGGYGYAYWANGLQWNYNKNSGDASVGYIASYTNNFTSSKFITYRYGFDYSGNVGTGTIKAADAHKICSAGLSDSFQTCISIYNPVFPLIDFLDAGEAIIDFGYVKNGGGYEAGAHGRSDMPPAFTDTNKNVKVGILRAGSFNKIADLGTLNDTNWKAFTLDVKAGDQFQARCQGSPNAGSTTAYSIFFFGKNIPGWKIAD